MHTENVKVKICGLKTMSEIEAVNTEEINYAGFIFVPRSKRYVKPFIAKELRKALKPGVKAVGVFQDESLNEILQIAETVGLDIIQLHGTEPAHYIPRLPYETWKVIPVVDGEIDLKLIETYKEADGLLFDTKVQNTSGGTGQTFPWNVIKDIDIKNKIVAGGIGEENIIQAIEQSNATIVDLNSKLEIDGYKTKESVKAIFDRLREVTHGA